MAKIPFSIDYKPQIESDEYKVETKNGVSVRIICWDAKGSNDRKDIIGLTSSTLGSENLQRYDITGHLIADSAKIGNKDLLIITPEPELTDWQKFISGCLQKYGLLDCGAADRIAKECSAELLELATKELAPTFGAEYMNGYEDGINYGRAKALKDLPRWRKIGRGSNYSLDTKFIINGRYLEMTDTLNDVFEVALSELEKLPKEYETQ